MTTVLLVVVGDNWPAKKEPPDNPHVKVQSTDKLSDHAEAIASALGVASLGEVTLKQGVGQLPDVKPGEEVKLEESLQDGGFVPPEGGDGEEPVAVIYAVAAATAGAGEAEDGSGPADEAAAAPAEPAAPAYDAAAAAKSIFEAVDGLGTNEAAIYATLEGVQRKNNWCAAAAAFKQNHGDCHDGDIIAALKDDLTDEEYEKAKKILQDKGIDIEDLTPDPEPEGGGSGKCPDCNNDLSQPFCGKSGRPHVAAGEGAPGGQFSTDRSCTHCGDGMLEEESRQAVFVCIECDGKFCEICWELEHRNKKRAHHQRYLLFFDCDLCPYSQTEAQAALWFCDPCSLLLCKQCWHNEHKHPSRRDHLRQFLYPGGEEGPYRAVTIDSQPDPPPPQPFDVSSQGAFITQAQDRVCTICSSADGPAVYICSECDPVSPELLCEKCWSIEHRMPHRRGHAKRLLLFPCDVCVGEEGRPATVSCSSCQAKMCDACWDIEHRNPARHNHTAEPLGSGAAFIPASRPVSHAVLTPLPPIGSPSSPHSQVSYYAPASEVFGYDPGYTAPYDTISPGENAIDYNTIQDMERFYHYRQRLTRFYQIYNPSKLPSVVSCLKEYEGYEEDLMCALARRYGPEPPEDLDPLPPGWRLVESTRGDLFYIHSDGRKQWQRPTL